MLRALFVAAAFLLFNVAGASSEAAPPSIDSYLKNMIGGLALENAQLATQVAASKLLIETLQKQIAESKKCSDAPANK